MRRAGKLALIVIALAIAVVILFTWVFPWVERYLEDPTFDAGAAHPVAVEAGQRSRSPS